MHDERSDIIATWPRLVSKPDLLKVRKVTHGVEPTLSTDERRKTPTFAIRLSRLREHDRRDGSG